MKATIYYFDYTCTVNGSPTKGGLELWFMDAPVIQTNEKLNGAREAARQKVLKDIHPTAVNIEVSLPFALREQEFEVTSVPEKIPESAKKNANGKTRPKERKRGAKGKA